VAFADVGDELSFAPADALSLQVTGPFAAGLPLGSSNLVMRAAQALRELTRVSAGARIRLVKNLPLASGLGGGSSDAAQALLGLSELWGLGGVAECLPALGARLGADVPVCLGARTSYFGGIGERLDPAPALPECWLVLANPGKPAATPAVFAARTGPYSSRARLTETVDDVQGLAQALASRRNDLESAAQSVEPAITTVLGALAETQGCLLARVSGSGATCFALYASAVAAGAAAARLAREHPGWWVRPARIGTRTSPRLAAAPFSNGTP
jgi:4-diphosphocytidyl-2-C-methyl-D-erythritol kinase